ncbi:MAG: TfoX/Sxy family protein [Saccharofermentanales bacterium]
MDWEKADMNLADALGNLLVEYEFKMKPMFGAPVYFVNNNMWTGVKGGKVFLRLSENDREAIQSESDEIRPFEPRTGFFMKEYVEIPDSKISDSEFIRKWLKISYNFVAHLPIKIKKEKKRK